MKKSVLFAIVAILSLILLVCSFASCDNSDTLSNNNQYIESNANNETNTSNIPDVCQHSFGSWNTVKQATCNEEGKLVRTCSKCSETEETTVSKTDIHTEVVDAAIAATCTTDGKTEGKHCSVCDETIVAQTIVKALGHTEIIDHAIDATCETEGKTEGKHCSVCSTVLKTQVSIPKLNHDYDNYICTKCGDEYYTTSLIFTLSEDEKSYIVSGITNNAEKTVVIPSKYNNKPVRAIGYEAFNESNIKSVVFGANIKLIDAWAFRACTQLTTIVLPDNLTQIGEGAFAGCVRLSSVVMNDNVETLGKMAFYQCSNLSSINLSKKLTSIGVGAFADNVKLVNIEFPSSLITIGEQAFVGCIKLKSVTIPNNVAIIDQYAFAQCTALEELNIGTSALGIGGRAFMECESLTSLYISGTVKYIDVQAFAYCTNLKEVIINDGLQSIGAAAFQGCSSLEYMELPFIGQTTTQNQFLGWIFGITTSYKDNPTYVPSSLKTIYFTGARVPSNALFGCNITVKYPFDEKTGLIFTLSEDKSYYTVSGTALSNPTEIFVPSTYNNKPVKKIASEAFANCDTITKVTISEGVEVIGSHAFYDCYRLLDIVIPDSIREIERFAFNYNTVENYYNPATQLSYLGNANNPYVVLVKVDRKLTGSISIHEGCRVIGTQAFKNSKITDVILPDSLKSISPDAFDECNSLESLSIPSGIIKIGTSAFRSNSLNQLTYRGTIDMWNNIEKEWQWYYGSVIYSIICTDGQI